MSETSMLHGQDVGSSRPRWEAGRTRDLRGCCVLRVGIYRRAMCAAVGALHAVLGRAPAGVCAALRLRSIALTSSWTSTIGWVRRSMLGGGWLGGGGRLG